MRHGPIPILVAPNQDRQGWATPPHYPDPQSMSLLPPAHGLVLFLTAALVLLVIPGPAVLLIVERSVDQGSKGDWHLLLETQPWD